MDYSKCTSSFSTKLPRIPEKIDIEIQSSFDNIEVIQNVERIGLSLEKVN